MPTNDHERFRLRPSLRPWVGSELRTVGIKTSAETLGLRLGKLIEK